MLTIRDTTAAFQMPVAIERAAASPSRWRYIMVSLYSVFARYIESVVNAVFFIRHGIFLACRSKVSPPAAVSACRFLAET